MYFIDSPVVVIHASEVPDFKLASSVTAPVCVTPLTSSVLAEAVLTYTERTNAAKSADMERLKFISLHLNFARAWLGL
jgi:hypothetical protein